MPRPASIPAISGFTPAKSIFVSANAGSGKTSLLTKRVLSLLLSGIEPSHILCLTFTNAAAAEMSARVLKQLGSWVMMEDAALETALAEIMECTPDKRQMAFARSLFAKVLDAPEGVRIQTIHAFCQSLLRRFPLEAATSPHFSVMDTRTSEEMMREAKIHLFNSSNPEVVSAVRALATEASEPVFRDLLKNIIDNRKKFILTSSTDVDLIIAKKKVWDALGVKENISETELLKNYFTYDNETQTNLRAITALLLEGGERDKKTGEGLARWLEKNVKSISAASEYRQLFLTDKGEPRKQLFNKVTLTDESLVEQLFAERDRVLAYDNACKAINIARRTCHMLTLAHALLGIYESQKQIQAQMDYDDLIHTASRLLTRDMAAWVLYKLDGGIDHILVDEAQDTSPEQWHIIKALSEEFFAGQGSRDVERTLFIVGDEKQSIYRFQGADVSALRAMQDYFGERISASGNHAERIVLNKSYRSLPAVLKVVDSVFSDPVARQGVMFDDAPLEHIAHRQDHEGYVEVWPFIGKTENTGYSAKSRLITTIADTIESWLAKPLWLESKDRPVNAGDIMILVRSRTDLVDRLSRALKRRNIPVAGIDRMQLTENLAVQDLLALGQILLLPDDDLSLACVLKSPIGNCSEEELFTLAHGRGGASLWQRLAEQAMGNNKLQAVFQLLSDLRAKVDYIPPFELFAYALDTCGIRKRITGRMGEEYNDAIDEFLSQAMLYERSHVVSMQGFLHWLSRGHSEVKRDMEQARGEVRIMTVHGAKGLQAPIVILPDTARKPDIKDKLFWNEESIPFWPENVKAYDTYTTGLRDNEKEATYAEYRRQLYVAMTRAEDMLCICGAAEAKSAAEDSWYDLVSRNMATLGTTQPTEHGQKWSYGQPVIIKKAVMPIEVPIEYSKTENDFTYLKQPLSNEPQPSKPIAPSRFPDDAPATHSPLEKKRVYSRGQCIHLLLQHLPEVTDNEREQLAEHISGRFRKSLSDAERKNCAAEAMRVISHADYAFLFSSGSMAEVPVAGVVRIAGVPYTVSGQIDRLYVGQEVWIVDYKTGHDPEQGADIPKHYLRQMTLYKQLLTQIYPDKPVRCALIWTSGPQMTIIPEALLDESVFSSYI